ncbi:MAG TPA: hypothetical protein VMH32_11260 [Burkholderiales bacterium]|nr:hypothetical protein [Burkholderiales bacterium]
MLATDRAFTAVRSQPRFQTILSEIRKRLCEMLRAIVSLSELELIMASRREAQQLPVDVDCQVEIVRRGQNCDAAPPQT